MGAILPLVEWLGLIAGAITTIGFLPQVIRVFRLRSAHEISLPFTLMFLIGVSCWLVYGILLQLMPVVLWNAISAIFALALLFAKLKYGR
jgi:MtN3 and saliva related transmembrane protein